MQHCNTVLHQFISFFLKLNAVWPAAVRILASGQT